MAERNLHDNGILHPTGRRNCARIRTAVPAGARGMKVSIQVLGSLGDVMPYISAAIALKARGADVSILAPVDYTPMIEAAGLKADRTANFRLAEWMERAAEKGTLSNPAAFFRDWAEMIAPHVDDTMDRALEAARGADIVVANLICAPARIAAEAEGSAFLLTAQQPVLSPTREAPCAMIWRPWMGQTANRVSYRMVWLAQRLIGLPLGRRRKRLGLPARPALSDMRTHLGQPLRKVTSVPPALMEKPPADWTAFDLLTPYPSLVTAPGAALSSGLEQFLSAGPAPVYVGLGSLSDAHGAAVTAAALEALGKLGLRGIFPTSLAKHRDLAAQGHFVCGHEPHDLLFPRCAAVIHHGGAGTVDSALRAGAVQIVQPHMLDQFWFASGLERIGVAGKPLASHRLGANDVINALEAAQTPARREAARRMRERSIGLDGAGALAGIILDEAARFSSAGGRAARHR